MMRFAATMMILPVAMTISACAGPRTAPLKAHAGDDHPTAVSGAAAGAAAADCAAAGWVSFDTAAAAAEAADRAIAKDDAWIAWVSAQAAAWPK